MKTRKIVAVGAMLAILVASYFQRESPCGGENRAIFRTDTALPGFRACSLGCRELAPFRDPAVIAGEPFRQRCQSDLLVGKLIPEVLRRTLRAFLRDESPMA